jgi:hypothetical protein
MKIVLLSATSLLLASAVHAQTASSVVVSGEEENALAEQQLFPQLLALRQVDGTKARSGQASFQLKGQAAPTLVSSALLPVQKGQQVAVEVYAHYAPSSPHKWLVPVATAVAGSIVTGTMPTPMGTDAARPTGQKITPYLGVGTALTIPRLFHHAPRHRAEQASAGTYLEYKFYDQQGTLLSSQRQAVSEAAKTDWQPLQVKLDAPSNGFVQLALGNDTKQTVWFDDLQTKISGATTPVVADSIVAATPPSLPQELSRPDSTISAPLVALAAPGDEAEVTASDAVTLTSPASTTATTPEETPQPEAVSSPAVTSPAASVESPTSDEPLPALSPDTPAPAPKGEQIPLPKMLLYQEPEDELYDDPGEDDPDDGGDGGEGGDDGGGDGGGDGGDGDGGDDGGDYGDGDDGDDGDDDGEYDLHYPENPSDGDQYTYVDSDGNVFEFVYDSELGLWVFPAYITVASAAAVQTTVNSGVSFPFTETGYANTIIGSALSVFDNGFDAVDALPAIDIAAKSEYLLMKSVGAVLKGLVRGSAVLTTGLDLALLIDHGFNPEYVIRFLIDALITAIGFTAYGTVPSIILAALNADGAFDDLYKSARYGGYQGAIDYIESL